MHGVCSVQSDKFDVHIHFLHCNAKRVSENDRSKAGAIVASVSRCDNYTYLSARYGFPPGKIAQVHALFMIIVYREGLDRICRLGSIPAGFSAINDR